MPFTPAHIAAILPFRKIVRSDTFTMLVIGSIVPDMEYFLRFNPASGFSHTINGVFLFDLPLCIFLFFLWRLYIKKILVTTLPYLRKDNFDAVESGNNFILVFAALTGIATHLIWDGFTHGKGFFVLQSDFLQQQLSMGVLSMKMCYAIWYVCSFLGTGWVLFSFFRFNKNTESVKMAFPEFWSKVFFSTMMIAVIRISLGLSHNVPRHMIIIFIGAFIYSFLIIAYASFLYPPEKKKHG